MLKNSEEYKSSSQNVIFTYMLVYTSLNNMKTLMLVVFLAMAATAFAEDCFTAASGDKWKPVFEACKTEIPAGTEDRLKKVKGCTYKKAGILSEDGTTLDFDGKYKAAYEEAKAKDFTSLYEEMDKCWASSNHVPTEFFDCWIPKVIELCPDSKEYVKDL